MNDSGRTSFLEVISPGICSLIVDDGRRSSRSLGIPLGGAFDAGSFAIGNALVGNPVGTPGLEINLAGPMLVANCNLAAVVTGGDTELSAGDKRLETGKTFTLPRGEILAIGSVTRGARSYLCLQGGLQGIAILGSQSSLQPIVKSQKIPCKPGNIQTRYLDPPPDPFLQLDHQPKRLSILWGTHANLFDPDAFIGTDWEVSSTSNRMGIRLMGKKLETRTVELESEPVCPGTIQVTNDGQCILLGRDGQTIGGYPRIAHVIEADWDRVAQLRAGDKIRFEPILSSEAEKRYSDRLKHLQQLLTRISLGAIWS